MGDGEETQLTTAEDRVDPLGGLTPRQRRLCQLLASGMTNAQIQKELGYSASRISVLQTHPEMRREIARLQDRVFEETIENQLKDQTESAMRVVKHALNDWTGRTKIETRIEAAKWLIEMQKSKAPQVHDIGQNMLAALMDRLDAKKTERKVEQEIIRGAPQLNPPPASTEIEITATEIKEEPKKDELLEWIDDFCSESK